MVHHYELQIEQSHFHDVEMLNLAPRREYQSFLLNIFSPWQNIQYANRDVLYSMVNPMPFHYLLLFSITRSRVDHFWLHQLESELRTLTHQSIDVRVYRTHQSLSA